MTGSFGFVVDGKSEALGDSGSAFYFTMRGDLARSAFAHNTRRVVSA